MDSIFRCLPHVVMVALACAVTLAACQTGRSRTAETTPPAGAASPEDSAASQLLYVGTASGDPEAGVYAFHFDPAAGTLSRAGSVTQILNPSFLARSPAGPFLYAVSESPETGTVSAYRIDAETGALAFLNRQPSGGAGPAYVSTDQTGRWVLAANYGSGSVALLPAGEDGRLGEAADVVQHEGSGPNPERQEGPHAHYVHVGPDNRYAYATDLGTDEVLIYPFDAENGRLNAEEAQAIATPPGAGPRHLDFYPDGRYVYLVNELAGTVTAYARDAATGGLTSLQTLSTLPEDFDGENKSADLHIHPSGQWLYVSNRGDADGIAIFSIDEETGQLTPAGYQREGIRWPRNFAITPSGEHLLVANRRANEVVVFRLDQETGQLTSTGQRAEVPEPTNITFVAPSE